ncbi:MAG TPA: nucleotidyltransferase family protein [Polyangiaceae bacterium]
MLPEVIVLAAGRSSRMGEPKGLWAIGGKPWLEHQLDAIEALGAEAVLVLGFDRERYLQALPELEDRASVVVNPAPEHGPFSSLQCGLRVSGAPAFVLPVDVPAPVADVWRALHAGLTERVDAVVPIHEGLGGHPVLLSPALVTHVLGLAADSRLDHVLRGWDPLRIGRIPVLDRRVRLNLNAPEDWGKLAAGT